MQAAAPDRPCSRPGALLAGLALAVAAARPPTTPAASPTRPAWSRWATCTAAYDNLVAILRFAGLVDAKAKWAGGKAHLVQTGDLLDRGKDARKVLDLLMRLEGEARKAGGRVHALLGNHEVMNMLGDLRYVNAEEYKAFQDAGVDEATASTSTRRP